MPLAGATGWALETPTMSMKQKLSLLALAALATAAGCTNPADSVANGVARLTIRNVGAVATIINADTTCGFSSDAVKAAAVLNGSVGGQGSLVLTVTDCEIDLANSEISKTCDDPAVSTTVNGKIKVSATRTVVGTLTGSAE